MPRADGRSAMILGRYVFHGEIASGGMASVCLGQMVGGAGFSRTVAIKRLHAHLVDDPEFSAMFLDEARLAARVRHPNVVSTLDVVTTDHELFLVMEYVPGESLAALARHAALIPPEIAMRRTLGTLETLPPPGPPESQPRLGAPEKVPTDSVPRRSTPMPPAIAAGIVGGALHGLHAAHEARGENGEPLEIVHRDVSPHNVLVGEDGVARLIDFGIARAAVRSQITRTGQLKGKLRYMAPEQLHGAPATRRADVYATSVVLWEALTGERLFDGTTEGAIYGRILEGVVRPPSALTAVPPALDAVVLRGLARDPEARWATALEMAQALEAAVTVASPPEVAGWLQRAAGPVLARRAQRVREIESGAGDPELRDEAPPSARAPRALRPAGATRSDRSKALAGRRVASVTARSDALATATLTMRTEPRSQRSGMRRGVIAAGAGLLVALAVGVGARAALVRPAVLEARRGLATAALGAAAGASAPGSTGAASAPAPAASAPEPAVTPSAKRAVTGSARARLPERRSACDPPYFTDATGIRRVKRECL